MVCELPPKLFQDNSEVTRLLYLDMVLGCLLPLAITMAWNIIKGQGVLAVSGGMWGGVVRSEQGLILMAYLAAHFVGWNRCLNHERCPIRHAFKPSYALCGFAYVRAFVSVAMESTYAAPAHILVDHMAEKIVVADKVNTLALLPSTYSVMSRDHIPWTAWLQPLPGLLYRKRMAALETV
jgi:hypothetical protein